MRLTCLTCHRPTIRAREIDGHMILIDAAPVGDGELAIHGDLAQEPTAIWNFDPLTDAEFWGIPADLPLHNRHRCTAVA